MPQQLYSDPFLGGQYSNQDTADKAEAGGTGNAQDIIQIDNGINTLQVVTTYGKYLPTFFGFV